MPSIDAPAFKQESTIGISENSLGYFPRPPQFDDKVKERAYLKFRLAQAFRIFGSLGYDEGVAGHITVRVGQPCPQLDWRLSTCDYQLTSVFTGSYQN